MVKRTVWTSVLSLIAWSMLTAVAQADPITDEGFFTSGPHTLITFEEDGNGDAFPAISNLTLPSTEYAGQGVTFEPTTRLTNDSSACFHELQRIGGSNPFGIISSNTTAMKFDPPVAAVGFWLVAYAGQDCTFTAIDADDNVIESVVFRDDFIDGTGGCGSAFPLERGFIGVSSDVAIHRLEIDSGFGVIDNLRFNAVPTPTAEIVVEQLESVAGVPVARLDGSGSSDANDEVTALTFKWTVDGAVVCEGPYDSCATIESPLSFGAHEVTLVVTDPDGNVGEASIQVVLEPDALLVLKPSGLKVEFDREPPRLKLNGEIGLPFGVQASDLAPLVSLGLNLSRAELASNTAINFELGDTSGNKWRHSDPVGPVTKFDIDWTGARFQFKESGFPLQLKSQVMLAQETILTLKVKKRDLVGPLSIDFNGQASVEIDADGGVTASSAVQMEKTGKEEYTLTLPFAFLASSTIKISGSASRVVSVGDNTRHSIGRFRMEVNLDPADFPDGVNALPRTFGLSLTVGEERFPGAAWLGADDLVLVGEDWVQTSGG